jgi:hypothetical protein
MDIQRSFFFMLRRVQFLLATLGLVACTPSEFHLDKELKAYVSNPDHGCINTIDKNGIQLSVSYRPTDLLISQEVEDELVTPPVIDSLRMKYQGQFYFLISFSRNNKELLQSANDPVAYSDLLQTLSFRMSSYVSLSDGRASVPPSDYMLNRTYGLASSTDLLFAFPRERLANTGWLEFEMKEFGLQTGDQHVRFKRSDLERIPPLNFNRD